MSCTVYIVYTFHITAHHANFGQFKAKQVLWLLCSVLALCNIVQAKNVINNFCQVLENINSQIYILKKCLQLLPILNHFQAELLKNWFNY